MLPLRIRGNFIRTISSVNNRGLTGNDMALNMLSRNDSVTGQSSAHRRFIHQLVAPFKPRFMSTGRGRSMRSKVEKRMMRETGRSQRELRRAVKLRKKLMTDDERLIYNLRRAKKKVALLQQKLKKYELPELPAPCHDPELLTAEQFQAFKKIGLKNKNYLTVGVRGVFGGVVQNMHMHWKFHETVQVCCDNFPREKIKEMATMLARLSGGIVINVHNMKTIIMFRGRNYRQPKNLIPFNTLTKRKALFKARFEQALESQKLNIKKIETQLRRKGISPEDPVAMASIQRVAATFFRAIDEQQGTPYIFHGDKQPLVHAGEIKEELKDDPSDDSDQEELDRFIANIEASAEKEWEEEEEAEKEEATRIRYWSKEDMDNRKSHHLSRNEHTDEDGDEDDSEDADVGLRRYPRDHGNIPRNTDSRKSRSWRQNELEDEDNGRTRYTRDHGNKQANMAASKWDSGSEVSATSEDEDWESEMEAESDADNSPDELPESFGNRKAKSSLGGHRDNHATRVASRSGRDLLLEDTSPGSEDDENDIWGVEENIDRRRDVMYDFRSGSDDEDIDGCNLHLKATERIPKNMDESWDSE